MCHDSDQDPEFVLTASDQELVENSCDDSDSEANYNQYLLGVEGFYGTTRTKAKKTDKS